MIRCVVPFCEGGVRGEPATSTSEAICPDHWRLVDKSLKAARTRGRKPAPDEADAEWFDARCWHRMKVQAVERAAGIA